MKGDLGVVETKYVTFAQNEKEFIKLSSGKKFGPITVAYETYGELNRDKTNAVLICHALSGNAHAAGYHKSIGHKPGWWNDAVGPGKAIDTDKYFVICSNVIGGCAGTTGPSSINPQTGKPYGATFPVITIGDMVKVQKLLIDYLGIEKLLCVIGGSMGGMQALEWSLMYPDNIFSAVVIAATARLSPQSIAFNAVGRNAIIRDENWHNGDYYGKAIPSVGLSIARMIGHITYLSDESMHKKFGRRLQERERLGFDFSKEFQVESYLDYQGNKFVEIFDANTYLYVTKAMDYFDVAATYGKGSLDEAMKRVKSRMLVISFTSDWLFPPYQSQEIVYALLKQKKDATYFNIESSYGHDAFLLEIDLEEKVISSFIDATFALRSKG